MSGLKFTLALALAATFATAARAHDHDFDGYIPIEQMPAPKPGEPHTGPGDPAKNLIKFDYTQRPEDEDPYPVARAAMAKMFAGTQYDKGRSYPINPSLLINQTDLNGDDLPEIIAVIQESTEEINRYCKWDSVCPYYIIDQAGPAPRTIGVIHAEELALGDAVKNGYWTIKAYTRQDEKAPTYGSYFETYAYDKAKKTYVREDAPSPAKP